MILCQEHVPEHCFVTVNKCEIFVLCQGACARAWFCARTHVLEHGFVPEGMC